MRVENWSTRGKSLGAEETTNKLFPYNYTKGSGNWTQAILVEGECSLHCANPSHWVSEWLTTWLLEWLRLTLELYNLFDCLSVGLSHNSRWCTLIPCFFYNTFLGEKRWHCRCWYWESWLCQGESFFTTTTVVYNYWVITLVKSLFCFPPNGGVFCWFCFLLSDVFLPVFNAPMTSGIHGLSTS